MGERKAGEIATRNARGEQALGRAISIAAVCTRVESVEIANPVWFALAQSASDFALQPHPGRVRKGTVPKGHSDSHPILDGTDHLTQNKQDICISILELQPIASIDLLHE